MHLLPGSFPLRFPCGMVRQVGLFCCGERLPVSLLVMLFRNVLRGNLLLVLPPPSGIVVLFIVLLLGPLFLWLRGSNLLVFLGVLICRLVVVLAFLVLGE